MSRARANAVSLGECSEIGHSYSDAPWGIFCIQCGDIKLIEPKDNYGPDPRADKFPYLGTLGKPIERVSVECADEGMFQEIDELYEKDAEEASDRLVGRGVEEDPDYPITHTEDGRHLIEIRHARHFIQCGDLAEEFARRSRDKWSSCAIQVDVKVIG